MRKAGRTPADGTEGVYGEIGTAWIPPVGVAGGLLRTRPNNSLEAGGEREDDAVIAALISNGKDYESEAYSVDLL